MRPADAAVAFSLLALAAASAVPGAALEPASVTYADGTFRLASPIHVAAGTVVTVRNATLLLDARASCPAACAPDILLEGGTLVVERSVLDTSLDVHQTGGWSLMGEHATLVVRDSVLANYSTLRMQAEGGEPSRVSGSTFRLAHGPLSFERGAVAVVEGNRFEDVGAGVSVIDGVARVSGNVLLRVAGAGRAIDVQATLLGDRLALRAPTTVEGNVVEDSTVGLLFLAGNGGVVRDNVFRNGTLGAGFGILYGGASRPPLVEGNRFEGNALSVSVALVGAGQHASPVTLEMRHNAFASTACRHIATLDRPEAQLVVDATGNWWGSPEGPVDRSPECPAVAGARVLVSPWAAHE